MVRRKHSAVRHNNYHKILVCVVLGLAAIGIALTPLENAPQTDEEAAPNRDLDPLPGYGFTRELTTPMGNTRKAATTKPMPGQNTLRLEHQSFVLEPFNEPALLPDLEHLLASPISTWSILKTIWRLDGTPHLTARLNRGDAMADLPFFSAISQAPTKSATLPNGQRLAGFRVLSQSLTLKLGASCTFCQTSGGLEPVVSPDSSASHGLNWGLLMAMTDLSQLTTAEAASTAHLYEGSQEITKPELMKSAARFPLPLWPVGAYSKPW